MLRKAFMAMTVLIAAAVLFGTGRTMLQRGGLVGLAQARWCFLIAVLAIGPGLVANVMLKDNWGRARPRQVVEFGGTKHFTPPLVPARECARNCSFVSGEASSAFVPFFAAALLLPQFRRVAHCGAGLAVGARRGPDPDLAGRPLPERHPVCRHLHGADGERAAHPAHRPLAEANAG